MRSSRRSRRSSSLSLCGALRIPSRVLVGLPPRVLVPMRDALFQEQSSTSGFRGCASKHQPTTTSGLVVIKYAGTCKGV